MVKLITSPAIMPLILGMLPSIPLAKGLLKKNFVGKKAPARGTTG
jgi:hypothetical protein